MRPRFYCSDISEYAQVVLEDSEHHHLAKVLRLQAGDAVEIFDGQGHECRAVISQVERRRTVLSVEQVLTVDRELPFRITLGVALPKGDRQQWLIEKAVELGVTRLVPLVTDRGVAQPVEKARERIQKWIVAASKQSRRNRFMELGEPQKLKAFFATSSGVKVVAHPDETAASLADWSPTFTEVNIAVGPEGGFSDTEVQSCVDNGATKVSLGERILRVETAAIAAAAGFIYGR